jgi:hypothetical protein
MIITVNVFIFARGIFSAVRITSVSSACVIVVTIDFCVFTSSSRIASYGVTGVFVFAFIGFIMTSNG